MRPKKGGHEHSFVNPITLVILSTFVLRTFGQNFPVKNHYFSYLFGVTGFVLPFYDVHDGLRTKNSRREP